MKAMALAFCFLAGCTTAGLPFPDVLRAEAKGSAVALSDSWVLTSKHLLPLSTVGGVRVLEVVEHPSEDLALLRLEPRPRTAAVLADEAPNLGDRLRSMGYHLSRCLLVVDGRQGENPDCMSCPIIFGASGGAVLNEAGELVGINKAVALIRSPMGQALPIPHVSHYVPVVGLRSWILSHINR